MSGHSKWATTKHKKAAIDAKRSSLFSKLSRNITVAAKLGGDPNPDNNASLAAAVARARMVSMPNAKIKQQLTRLLVQVQMLPIMRRLFTRVMVPRASQSMLTA